MSFNEATHKAMLVTILKDVFAHPLLGPVLAFKGGTAAYLFRGLPRASIDLDFDLIASDKKINVQEEMREVLASHGTLKDEAKTDRGAYFLLSYATKSKDAPNIKIDINFRKFGSSYETLNYMGIAMRVMTTPDMTAHKLVAMYERLGKANRDIYDTWFFLKNGWPVNRTIVESRAGMTYADFLRKCVEKLEKMSNQRILDGLGEMIDERQKVWIKAHLRDEAVFQLKLLLDAEK